MFNQAIVSSMIQACSDSDSCKADKKKANQTALAFWTTNQWRSLILTASCGVRPKIKGPKVARRKQIKDSRSC